MVSVMATRNEVFGSCVGEIVVSVGMENRGVLLCCGVIFMRFILAGKVAQYLRWGRVMVPGIGGRFGCLRMIEEIKSPCRGRGFDEVGLGSHLYGSHSLRTFSDCCWYTIY